MEIAVNCVDSRMDHQGGNLVRHRRNLQMYKFRRLDDATEEKSR